MVPEPTDWPISFGITPPQTASRQVRVRLRAFRGLFATPGMLGDTATLEPPKEVTIDRLVELPQALDGVEKLRVLLTEDCLGVPSSSLDATTCVDADHLAAPLGSGFDVVTGAEPASKVGSWAGAVEVPCGAPAPEGRVCIPGGFSILGELSFAGIADGVDLLDSAPLHPVRLSPFYMDTTEFTVTRLRSLPGFPKSMTPEPPTTAATDPFLAFCTWTPTGNDYLPVNCIQWDAAKLACSLAGGLLPTEAQWEHAARGRGQRRLYPWGDEAVTCCAASASRMGASESDGGPAVECGPASGIEPVGSHPAAKSCGGLGDVSRDGVLDMGGSVTEVLLDRAAPFDAACWATPGIASNPSCLDASFPDQSARGGYWNGGLAITLSPLRQIGPQASASAAAANPGAGFRCIYPEGS